MKEEKENNQKVVRWSSEVTDNEGATKELRKQNKFSKEVIKKLDKQSLSVSEWIVKYLEEVLLNKAYLILKSRLNKHPDDTIGTLKTDHYRIFKLMVEKGDAESLQFLFDSLPTKKAKVDVLKHPKSEVIWNFVEHYCNLHKLGKLDLNNLYDIAKVLFKIDAIFVLHKFADIALSRYKMNQTIPMEIKKVVLALSDQFDSFGNEIQTPTSSTTDTQSAESNKENTEPKKQDAAKSQQDASQTDRSNSQETQSDSVDTSIESTIIAKQNESDGSDSSNAELSSYLFKWIYELPEWLQQQILESEPVKQLMKLLSGTEKQISNVFTVPDLQKESRNDLTGFKYYEELKAQVKLEETNLVEMPDEKYQIDFEGIVSTITPKIDYPSALFGSFLTCMSLNTLDAYVYKSSDSYSAVLPIICGGSIASQAISNLWHTTELESNLIEPII